jgi:hypothetical protein
VTVPLERASPPSSPCLSSWPAGSRALGQPARWDLEAARNGVRHGPIDARALADWAAVAPLPI